MKFRELKDFRNSLFHAKVEDALKSFAFIEGGFFYNCDLTKYKQQFLPAQKFRLSAEDVLEVKERVDSVMELIMSSMETDTRRLTKKYIMESTHIPFFVTPDGRLSLGTSGTKQNGRDLAQHDSPPDSEGLS